MRERAYRELRRKILSGEVRAGAPLPEASLARELGLSRTPLREAIGRLAAEGLLKQLPNRGAVVLEFARRDIDELYDLREALEVYAVGKACEQWRRAQDLDVLAPLVDGIPKLASELAEAGAERLDQAQMDRFVQLDLSYHSMLLQLGGNARLMKVVVDTRVLLHVFAMRRRGHDGPQLAEIHDYHQGILDALRARDGSAAMQLLGEHIRASKQERLQEYEDYEREAAISSAVLAVARSR